MSAFISDFDTELSKHVKGQYRVLIESLNCKGIHETDLWKSRFQNLLNRHKNENIKAVIVLGQEAFATYLSLDTLPVGIPFFVCFASENGLQLPIGPESKSINMVEQALKKGLSGGFINCYNIKENVNLILNLYPDTKNIVFVSDNTYGGISLQALVKKEIANYPSLNFIFIDSREKSLDEAIDIIAKLSKNSALLLGTWRVDKNGMYMLDNSVNTLISKNDKLPVFTVTGTGLGSIAIGGYMPKYAPNSEFIADQISKYYKSGNLREIRFLTGTNYYTFDKQQLRKYNIRESHLPIKSIIVDPQNAIILQYQNYIITALVVIALLVILIIWMYRIYRKNKRLQDELIVAKNRAEESDRLKTAFLANMGHEIRTPLNAIVGFSALLCENATDDESRKEYSDIIHMNSELLLTLINDILDISRMEAGKLVFYYNNEDVVAVCDQIIMTTEHLNKPGVEVSFIRPAENIVINTDIKRISQVLINLMTNAIKFTDQGCITLTYKIDRVENMVVFSVTDTGCGIAKELHHMVFSRFEKLNNCKQGTGLGLAISKQIATHFGGDVWIDSSYSTGCRFYFSHPINRVDQDTELQ